MGKSLIQSHLHGAADRCRRRCLSGRCNIAGRVFHDDVAGAHFALQRPPQSKLLGNLEANEEHKLRILRHG
jgi:hypothetical protein